MLWDTVSILRQLCFTRCCSVESRHCLGILWGVTDVDWRDGFLEQWHLDIWARLAALRGTAAVVKTRKESSACCPLAKARWLCSYGRNDDSRRWSQGGQRTFHGVSCRPLWDAGVLLAIVRHILKSTLSEMGRRHWKILMSAVSNPHDCLWQRCLGKDGSRRFLIAEIQAGDQLSKAAYKMMAETRLCL